MIYFFFFYKTCLLSNRIREFCDGKIVDIYLDIHIITYLYAVMLSRNKMQNAVHHLDKFTVRHPKGLLDNIRIITFLLQYILTLSQNTEIEKAFINLQIKKIRMIMHFYHILYSCI